MDLAPWIAAIVAINLLVFLAGCALALYRSWRQPRNGDANQPGSGRA
jgi:hypothetical protein